MRDFYPNIVNTIPTTPNKSGTLNFLSSISSTFQTALETSSPLHQLIERPKYGVVILE